MFRSHGGWPDQETPLAESPSRSPLLAPRKIPMPRSGSNAESARIMTDFPRSFATGQPIGYSAGAPSSLRSWGVSIARVVAVGGFDPSGGAGGVRDLLTART